MKFGRLSGWSEVSSTPPQNVAWKFTEPKYMARFFELGVVRIGTAEEMRRYDETVAGRGDADELAHTVEHKEGYFVGEEGRPEDIEEERAIRRLGPFGENVRLRNIPVLYRNASPKRFHVHGLMFCMSSKLTPELVRRMGEEFGYTACYRIADVELFMRLICDHFPLRMAWRRNLAYADHTVQITDDDWNRVDPFRKRKIYEWQREHRILIPDPEKRARGFCLLDPRLPTLCDPVSAAELAGYRRIE